MTFFFQSTLLSLIRVRSSIKLALLYLFFCTLLPAYSLAKDSSRVSDTIRKLETLVQINRVRNNSLSVKLASRALKLALTGNNAEDITTAYLLSGQACLSTNADTSFFYLSKGLHIADSINYLEGKARILLNVAELYYSVSDYKTAVLLYDSVYRIAESGEMQKLISASLNALGALKLELGDSIASKKLYSEALDYANKHKLIVDQGVAIGNLAFFENNIRGRISMLKKAIAILEKCPGTEEEVAQLMINLGASETDTVKAVKYFQSALDVATKANLQLTRIAVLNNMAYTYLDLGQVDKAEDCLLNRAIPEAKSISNSEWLATLYDSYGDVLKAKKDFKGALEYKQLAALEQEKADYLKASSQVRLLAAMLDSKNKEITIQKNNQAIEAQKFLIRRQFMALMLAGAVILAFVLIVVIILQKTRLKIKTQQVLVSKQILELEEKERASVSRELHDTVSNLVEKLTGHIDSVNIGSGEEKSGIREKLGELSKSIRRISHRIQGVDFNDSPVGELIGDLCYDMANLTGMAVNCRLEKDFPALPFEKAKLLYRICEELLNNASKYAREAAVLLTLKSENGQLILTYSDDGPGFTPGQTGKPGIGVNNIKERARLLGGEAICTTSPGSGVDWIVRFPKSNNGGNRK